MKQDEDFIGFMDLLSHSARSAWIETSELAARTGFPAVALRKECVD